MISYKLTTTSNNIPEEFNTKNKLSLISSLERHMIVFLGRELIEDFGMNTVILNMPDLNETGVAANRYYIVMIKNGKTLELFINFSLTYEFGVSITFMKENDDTHYHLEDNHYFDLNRMNHSILGMTTPEMESFIRKYFENEKKEAN